MKRALFVIFGLMTAVAAQPAQGDAVLRLSADTPSVNVAPREPGRAPFSLPDLEYRFKIDVSCIDDMEPASLSLAVADTRRRFDNAQIIAGELADISLKVPAAQLAPVVIADFCVADHADPGIVDRLRSSSPPAVRAALSAQASLVCASENTQSIVYATEVLKLLLVCDEPSAPSGSQAE